MSEFRDIPLGQLEIGNLNVRRRDITADLDELANSLKNFGLQHPIVVQPKNGKYEIIIGQRRYLAAKQLGWKTITAKVEAKKYNEFQAKVMSFSENVQRRDLTPRDKAEACSYLLKRLKTPAAVAEHLGITEVTVRKWLDYSELVPEGIKSLVDKGTIKAPLAIRLAQSVPDEQKAVSIAERIAKAPKDEKDRVIEAAEESAGRSVETIFRRAEELKRRKRITFILPEKWAYSMDRAVKRLNSSPSDIARDATIEWLQMMRY